MHGITHNVSHSSVHGDAIGTREVAYSLGTLEGVHRRTYDAVAVDHHGGANFFLDFEGLRLVCIVQRNERQQNQS
jgi:hypothetical protein